MIEVGEPTQSILYYQTACLVTEECSYVSWFVQQHMILWLCLLCNHIWLVDRIPCHIFYLWEQILIHIIDDQVCAGLLTRLQECKSENAQLEELLTAEVKDHANL